MSKRASDVGIQPLSSGINERIEGCARGACQSCRARSVSCDVTEQSPCTNCRLAELECVVLRCERKQTPTETYRENECATTSCTHSPNTISNSSRKILEHLPHLPYQGGDLEFFHSTHNYSLEESIAHLHDQENSRYLSGVNLESSFWLLEHAPPSAHHALPAFIKAFPSTYDLDDLSYLDKKGALVLPPPALRCALLRCFVENIHPYMPLLDIHKLIHTVENNGTDGTISLLVFQAIMFAGIASVDMKYLQSVGYISRRAARREFYHKTRILYDFDCEADRVSVIQSLLLMTLWFETPDDQKDGHHWMGVAVSLSCTIGLHRVEDNHHMESKQKHLWKRIWWVMYMRDRFIALGMRRPTRISTEDYEVPMLTIDDFDLADYSDGSCCISPLCEIMRNISVTRDLAIMCIEKAKLCVCINHILLSQYSVLYNDRGAQTHDRITKTTMMLVAKADDLGGYSVKACDEELRQWKASIASEAAYITPSSFVLTASERTIALHRSLLHMIYLAALSALHRPQILSSTAARSKNMTLETLEVSHRAVCFAANKLTAIAHNLNELGLIPCLPTFGIPILLPAIIVHIHGFKEPSETISRASLQGFYQIMQILAQLQDIYTAADYSIALVELALHNAKILVHTPVMGASDTLG